MLIAHPLFRVRQAAPSLQEIDALIADLEAYLATDAAERTTDGVALVERAHALLAATAPKTRELLFSRTPRHSR